MLKSFLIISFVFISFYPSSKVCLAQVVNRSNIPAPAFEVTGSIYPWDIADEGMDQIIDNLTTMAGVNSFYLIAVMHEEHRPFNSDRLPGQYYYIHNPARKFWDAEDARAYFTPNWSSYGKIRPLKSRHEFLNNTDYLKILLDKAHARGYRAGVEVSHNYLPKDILKEHPEFKQRDIYDRIIDTACVNHPDVREYLVNLYADLASNYDVDYIQTCMLMFSPSENPRMGGTCFCTSCKKKAKESGFDLEAAIPILRDNPNAQPQLDQWMKFRASATTEMYKQVIDKIHSINPKIDFRLNELNDRSRGLRLEELKDHINSVHLSTHTEQNGFQKTDRASRMVSVKYYMGDKMTLIPGVPTRLMTNKDIVRSSVLISIAGGARGIGIKHYDGSPFSLLRAARNAISEGGVSGFTPIKGMEVEEMRLSGYESERFLLEYGVQTISTGTATASFGENSGKYNVLVTYVDEKEGQGNISLYVGKKQIATWKLNEDIDCWKRKTIPNVKINKGDVIKLVGVANGKEKARADFIEFVPIAAGN